MKRTYCLQPPMIGSGNTRVSDPFVLKGRCSAVIIIFPLLFPECDSTCVGCTGKGPGQCKECIPGYTKESGQCTGQCAALRRNLPEGP